MADTLEIFGIEYQGVDGIKAEDDNGNTLTFYRPHGTTSISTNGTVDVSAYASASVNVPTGTARDSSDLTASNLTVTAPAGLYASNATKTLTDANLTAGNIKKNVTVFGVTGSYEGSGGGTDYLAERITDTLTNYTNNSIVTVKQYAFAYASNLQSVSLPLITTVENDVFKNTGLINIASTDFESATFLKSSSFRECQNLEAVFFPAVTRTQDHVFTACKKLKTMVFPVITDTGSNSFANDCYLLEKADMGSLPRLINADFYGARAMSALILRKSDGICQLQNTNCLADTPLRGYGGTYSGHVYVPQSLINTYKQATNWVTLYTDYADIFEAIEGSPYENYYADGTPISS